MILTILFILITPVIILWGFIVIMTIPVFLWACLIQIVEFLSNFFNNTIFALKKIIKFQKYLFLEYWK